MIEKIKQNKNTSVIRFFSLFLAVFVLVLSISIPSFAYTDTSTNGKEPFELPYYSGNSTQASYHAGYDAGKPFATKSSKPCSITQYMGASEKAYCFVTGTTLYVCSFTSNIKFEVYSNDNGYYSREITTGGSGTKDSATNLYYRSSSVSNFTDFLCPVYSSLNAGLAAILDYINNPPLPPLGSPAPIAVTLKPGYVAYFDISDLTVHATLGTSLFSGSKYPGFSTSQSIGVVSSLPAGSFSLPISGTSSINWSGSGQKNLIGQYSNFSYSYVTTSVGTIKYLVVVNPLSGSMPVLTAAGASASNRNGNITVLIDNCRGSKIYSLTESLSVGSGTLDTDSSGVSVNDGSFDTDSGAWDFTNPSTGLPSDPDSLPAGGGNDPIIGGSGGNSINDFLQDISNSIKGFFSGAIGAVTTLVSAGSDFIHSLSGLYAWLPSPVYSVLVSALILVITIGVIKVFI